MSSHEHAPLRPVVVGANHRSSSLGVRDRLFVEEEAVPSVLASLRDANVGQALLLSTCDRVEVTAVDPDPVRTASQIESILAGHACLSSADLNGDLYTLYDDAAVRHLLGVASSLDSQIIGEPHVLGQLKSGHATARHEGMIGSELEALLQTAYGTAKRVRTETAIGRRAVSIAAAAVERAQALHGDLADRTVLVVGSGDMGTTVVEALKSEGIKRLMCAHPTPARAERMARHLDGHVVPFDDPPAVFSNADVLIAALGGRRWSVGPDEVRAALKRRRYRPMLLIDCGIPGDVDPGIEELEEAYRYTLDDLERLALAGRAHREQEAEAAWQIVDASLSAYQRSRSERAAAPVLEALHRHFDAVRQTALDDAGGDADKATRLLVGRLLHGPSKVLRGLADQADENGADLEVFEHTLDRVFSLSKVGKRKDAS